MKIISLTSEQESLVRQAAQLLVESFREHWPDAWPTLEQGREEVQGLLETERICRVAVDEEGNLLGMIGGIPGYDGNVWELHPLAVQPSLQGHGIGRALVADFEEQVRLRGGLTITLGTDDEDSMTSLSDVDLYENLWEKIRDHAITKITHLSFIKSLGTGLQASSPTQTGEESPIF